MGYVLVNLPKDPRSGLCAGKSPCDHDAMSATEKTVAGTAPGLRRDAIGLREVLFQSITDMAPGAAHAGKTGTVPRQHGTAASGLTHALLSATEISVRSA